MSLHEAPGKDIAKLIRCVVSNEDRIELARITLAKNAKFNCRQSFRRIDKANRGYITDDDFRQFLKLNGLFPQQSEIERYCGQRETSTLSFSYNGFVEQLLPQTSFELKDRCLENDRIESYFELDSAESKKIDRLITAVFEREFRFMKELESILRYIRIDTFENDVHHFLFDVNKEELTFAKIKQFMERNFYSFEKHEYDSLLRRIDKNTAGKIILFDFLTFFFPFIKPKGKTYVEPLPENNIAIASSPIIQKVSPIRTNYDPVNLRTPTGFQRDQENRLVKSFSQAPEMVLLSSCRAYINEYKERSLPLSFRGINEYVNMSNRNLLSDKVPGFLLQQKLGSSPTLPNERKRQLQNLSGHHSHKRITGLHQPPNIDISDLRNVQNHSKSVQNIVLNTSKLKVNEIDDLMYHSSHPNSFYRKYYAEGL